MKRQACFTAVLGDAQAAGDVGKVMFAKLVDVAFDQRPGVGGRLAARLELGEFDQQALAEVAGTDPRRIERLQRGEHRLDAGDRRADSLCRLGDGDSDVTVAVEAADKIFGDDGILVWHDGAKLPQQVLVQRHASAGNVERIEVAVVVAAEIERARRNVIVPTGEIGKILGAVGNGAVAGGAESGTQRGAAAQAVRHLLHFEGGILAHLSGDSLLQLLGGVLEDLDRRNQLRGDIQRLRLLRRAVLRLFEVHRPDPPPPDWPRRVLPRQREPPLRLTPPSLHAQFPPGIFGHALRRPRRIVGQRHGDALDAGHVADVALDVAHHFGADRTADGRQRHGDVDGRALELEMIDQAEIDNIDGDLRVVTLAHSLVDGFDIDGGLPNDLRLGMLFRHCWDSSGIWHSGAVLARLMLRRGLPTLPLYLERMSRSKRICRADSWRGGFRVGKSARRASAASGAASMSSAASRAGVIGSARVEPGSAEIGEGEEVAAVGFGGMKAEWAVRAGEEERGHLGLGGRVDHLFAGVESGQLDAELFAHLAMRR